MEGATNLSVANFKVVLTRRCKMTAQYHLHPKRINIKKEDWRVRY